MHQPGWRPRPDREFMDEVEKATSGPGWGIGGNYRRFVGDGPVWRRADTVVWLDLPRRTVVRQVLAMTARRAALTEGGCHGNPLPACNFAAPRPGVNAILCG